MNQFQRCDVDLLLAGAFAPLRGFLTEADYESVVQNMTLTSGALWPMPVVLDLPEELAITIASGDDLLLAREDRTPLARLLVEDVYRVDLRKEARFVYGTDDPDHAGVAALLRRNSWNVGGLVQPIDWERVELARRADFLPYYRTPEDLKERFKRITQPVVAFHTRNPMHGAHRALTLAARDQVGGHILLHPTTGPTNPGDLSPAVRLKAILALVDSYPLNADGSPSVTLATLPLAMRMAGPREALWHALIRQNYGADYFIVGRAPADPGKNPRRSDGFWYPPFRAQELLKEVQDRMTISPLVFPEYVYDRDRRRYWPVTGEMADRHVMQLSGTKVRKMLREGEVLPDWYAPAAVREVLQNAFDESQKGSVIFLTGLPASGKSTLAKALYNLLTLRGEQAITLLDGDVIRRHLSKGLGFTNADRIENLERVGFVASLIVRHGGIAIVAMVAPLEAARRRFREIIEPEGDFIEVYVATPLKECERRDPKGLYRQARLGEIDQMTGIQSPYEAPTRPDLQFVSGQRPFAEDLTQLISYLEECGVIARLDPVALAAVSQT